MMRLDLLLLNPTIHGLSLAAPVVTPPSVRLRTIDGLLLMLGMKVEVANPILVALVDPLLVRIIREKRRCRINGRQIPSKLVRRTATKTQAIRNKSLRIRGIERGKIIEGNLSSSQLGIQVIVQQQ
jgi:hypothetical protein